MESKLFTRNDGVVIPCNNHLVKNTVCFVSNTRERDEHDNPFYRLVAAVRNGQYIWVNKNFSV